MDLIKHQTNRLGSGAAIERPPIGTLIDALIDEIRRWDYEPKVWAYLRPGDVD